MARGYDETEVKFRLIKLLHSSKSGISGVEISEKLGINRVTMSKYLNKFAAEGVSAVQTLMGGGGKAVSDFLSGKGTMLKDKQGQVVQQVGQGTKQAIQEAIKTFTSVQAQRAATTKLAIEAVNLFGANVSFNQLLARSDGKILNPNMELLFNNVTLRTFRFSFKLAPRDPNEATVVKSPSLFEK